MTFLIVIHVIACIGLVALVLIQRGRGAGLVETFSGVESMFGTKTSVFLTRLTTILAVLFFISCLSLALLSVRQSRSLMRQVTTEKEAEKTAVPPPAAEPAGAAQENSAKPQEQPQPPQPPPHEVPKTEK